MKKTLGKVLSILIVMSMLLSTMAFVSFATGTYEQIEVGVVGTVTLTEENPSVYVEFTPTESGYYVISSDNSNYSSCDPKVYIYDSYSSGWFAYDDDGGEGNNFSCGFNAEEGETYHIKLTTYDGSVAAVYDYFLETVEIPTSISAVGSRSLIEDVDGYFNSVPLYDDEGDFTGEYDEYFVYSLQDADLIYTIELEDGTYVGDEEFICEKIGIYPDYSSTQDYENQWGIGTHEIEVSIADVTGTGTVEVIANPLESISVTSSRGLIENYHGDYRTDSLYDDFDEYIGESEEYFQYDLDFCDFMFSITYKDGTVYTGDRWEIEDSTGYWIHMYEDQSYDNQWGVGSHDIEIEFMGETISYSVTVVESPVDYIEFEDIKLIENTDGYWDYDSYYDEELDQNVQTDEYFRYSFTPIYTVVMKDGTRCESDEYGEIVYNDEYYCFYYDDTQDYENQWGVGTHEIEATFLGKECTFSIEVVETLIESMTLTPVRDLIIGWDDYEDFYYWNEFIAEIEFKDGSIEECYASDLYREYGYDCGISDAQFVSDYECTAVINFMGYEGEINFTFIDNPYESITISGLNELVISLNKPDGTSDVATAKECHFMAGDETSAIGYLFTDKGEYPVQLLFEYDENNRANKNVKITIGDMESNTLEEHNWCYAFIMSQDLYGSIQTYKEMTCEHYYDREFIGLDITNSNYNITDIGNISAMILGYLYECEHIEDQSNDYVYYSYLEFDADDVIEMIEHTFNISNVDITEHSGYISADHTVLVPAWGGYGDWADSDYSLKYVDGKWYATRELYYYYSGETDYINLVLSDDILIEKISFAEPNLNGWILENGKWAYYENGIKATNRWILDSVGWCYVGSDGYCVTNTWKADSVGWCYLDANGRMVYNKWIYDGGKWYFINANGYMVSNQWKKDSIGWCYLGSSGAMLTNAWVKDSVGWCYVGADGYCVTNTWKADSKGWCYLDASGRMATNKWVKDSVGWCYVGADGYCVTNTWKADSKGWCYLDANGRMVVNNWVKDGDKWYYMDGNGYMVTGTKKIGGKTYKFASNGVWIP